MVAHRNSGESESKVSEARTGMGTASERLVAPLARRRLKLKEKGKVRPHKQIARRMPAGSSALGSVPKGNDYASAQSGKKQKTDVAAYCKQEVRRSARKSARELG